MDSSRGGPFANLLLILPLVIVPALAMLRPAERNSGLLNDDVAAAGDGFPSDTDDFDAMFEDAFDDPPPGTRADETETHRHRRSGDETAEMSDDETLFEKIDRLPDRNDRSDRRVSEHHDPHHDSQHGRPAGRDDAGRDEKTADIRRLPRPNLSRYGATDSVWFRPGDEHGSIGFAAFVPGLSGDVRYRFSAIGTSQDAVVKDVIRQIQNWQRQQRAAGRRTK